LTRPLLLHRRKEDCLDLPAKERRMVKVELDQAEGRGFQHRLQRKVEDYRRRVALGEVRRDAEALAVFTALRQIGADYKLPAAAALVADLLAQGESVVVFCSFMASAQLLQQRLGGQLLTGQVRLEDRQRAVDGFQAGDPACRLPPMAPAAWGSTCSGPAMWCCWSAPGPREIRSRQRTVATASAWREASPATGYSSGWPTSWWMA
jgi:SNF2 family DNA or RNA helicase